MKTLLTRSLSGAVFAAVMLLGIVFHPYTFAALFFVICMGCLWEYYTIVTPLYSLNRIGANAYRVLGIAVGAMIYLIFMAIAFGWVGVWTMWAVMPLLFVPLAFELLSLSPHAIRNAALTITGLVYIGIPFGLLMLMAFSSAHEVDSAVWRQTGCVPVLGLMLLIWANDTFAYLGGSLIGRNKLYPEISPGKTWEGFAVGAVFALGVAYLLYLGLGVYALHVWLGLGLIASVIGTVGDLFESMIKRNVGIKDSGNIMPGHGGFLDRFDAFIFCIPFAWVWLVLVS